MKLKLLLAAAFLVAAATAQAQFAPGQFRSTSTYTTTHTPTPDYGCNAPSYRSYTTGSTTYDHTPSSRSGYGRSGYSGTVSIYGSSTRFGNSIYHDYQSSDGRSFSGTTSRLGDTTYTTLNGW